MLRYWTAGESHGKTLLAVVDGFPAGIEIDTDAIDYDLRMRQGGYGRGGRQKIETDQVELLTGVWKNVSMGSPVTLQVINRDYKLEKLKELERPRPGHGDLTGAVKFLGSIRNVLERSSARETAVRVAAGALAKQILAEFQIECIGFVDELGGQPIQRQAGDIQQWRTLREQSEVYSLNPEQDPEIKQLIDQAGEQGDTLGGILEVHITGLPFGLGTHAQWDRKLDGRIAQAVMAVQAIKGVEIGLGFEAARRPGSRVHDPITYDADKKDTPSLGFQRPTNWRASIWTLSKLIPLAMNGPMCVRFPLRRLSSKTSWPLKSRWPSVKSLAMTVLAK
jgi:chorismate synthase